MDAYYVFSVKWSQTDHEHYIVHTNSRAAAQKTIDARYPNAYYRDLVCVVPAGHLVPEVK